MSEDKPKESKLRIDPDKVTDNPGLLPYAHHVGSAIIRPIDQGKQKGLAMNAMFQQTETALTRIKDQVEVLIRQAQDIHNRIDLSEKIYEAQCGITPIIGQIYYLYQRANGETLLSMVKPEEWGKNPPYTFLASAELLSDHTWKILEKASPDIEI